VIPAFAPCASQSVFAGPRNRQRPRGLFGPTSSIVRGNHFHEGLHAAPEDFSEGTPPSEDQNELLRRVFALILDNRSHAPGWLRVAGLTLPFNW
jgi:hypothetical protein